MLTLASHRLAAPMLALSLLACDSAATPVVDGGVDAPVAADAGSDAGPPRGGMSAACTSDIDCVDGLECFESDITYGQFGTGGPAHGYCSRYCDVDADCGGTGTCLNGGSGGVCFANCTFGPALTSPSAALDPSKCSGRDDVTCSNLGPAGPICVPTCRSNSDCPTGRICSPVSGTCSRDPATPHDRAGTCDDATCSGICLNLPNGGRACTDRCTLGGDTTLDCGGNTVGFCALTEIGLPVGAGDIGYCTAACTHHDDCLNPQTWCTRIEGGAASVGYCLEAPLCSAECIGDHACTPLQPDGNSYCVETAFPLSR